MDIEDSVCVERFSSWWSISGIVSIYSIPFSFSFVISLLKKGMHFNTHSPSFSDIHTIIHQILVSIYFKINLISNRNELKVQFKFTFHLTLVYRHRHHSLSMLMLLILLLWLSMLFLICVIHFLFLLTRMRNRSGESFVLFCSNWSFWVKWQWKMCLCAELSLNTRWNP